MVKFTRLLTLLVCLSSLLGVKAETINNYLEKFDRLSTELVPQYWERVVDSKNAASTGESCTVFYNDLKTGGYDGAYLKIGVQTQVIYDNDFNELETVVLNDYLITPMLGGEVSFYLKKSGLDTPNVKVYDCAKIGGKWSVGNLLKEIKDTEISDTWTKFTVPGVPAGTFLALRLESVGLDEFSAETAEIDKAPDVIAMEIKSAVISSGMKAVTDADNKFEVTYDVKVRNTGNVDLTPGMKDYSLTMLRKVGEKVEELITLPINQTVLAGETSEVIQLSVRIDAGDKPAKNTYYIRENITKTESYGKYVESKPYVPELELWNFDTNEVMTSADTINLGYLYDYEGKMKFRIANPGFAPLNITKVELPKGYTTTFETPFVLDGLMTIAVPVVLPIDKAGTFEGKISVSGDNVETQNFNITALVIDQTVWFNNFESGTAPSNMVLEKNWGVLPLPKDYKATDNNFVLENREEIIAKAISPLMTVKKGETLKFRAANASFVSKPELSIYYSADRLNWKLAREFQESEFSSETVDGYFSSFEFSDFEVSEIPEGNWYIAFVGAKVRIDDILGFKMVPVEHDFYINATEIPAFGRVNNTLSSRISVKNLMGAEPQDSYAVKLYLDGKVAGEAVCPKFMMGNRTFDINFTPHKEGKFPVYFEISAGDVVVKSAVSEIVVKNELSGEKQEMSAVKPGTGYQAPITLGYELSESQTVYPASKLNLQAGTKITGLSYDGFSKIDGHVVTNIQVYLENTTDVAPDVTNPKDVSTMTCVFNDSIEFFTAGSADNTVDMLAVKLNEPFVYRGPNLRVVVVANSSKSMPFDFKSDKAVTTATIHRENAKNIDWGTWYTTVMPLVNIYTEKDVPTLSGKVCDATTNKAVEHANVKLVSGNFVYMGETDAEGLYSIPVIQNDKEYQLTVEAEGYQKYLADELINLSNGNQQLDIRISPLGGVEDVETVDFVAFGGEGCVYVQSSEAIMVNIHNIAGRLVRSVNVGNGKTIVEGLVPGFYIVNGMKVLVK